MSLSNKLKELRLQNGLSQEQLSRKLDIATRTYVYYEKGQRNPPIELLTQMADIFNVSISFLMDEQGKEQGCRCGKLGTNELVEIISALFASGELSEAEKDAVMKALQEAYWAAKKKNE